MVNTIVQLVLAMALIYFGGFAPIPVLFGLIIGQVIYYGFIK